MNNKSRPTPVHAPVFPDTIFDFWVLHDLDLEEYRQEELARSGVPEPYLAHQACYSMISLRIDARKAQAFQQLNGSELASIRSF